MDAGRAPIDFTRKDAFHWISLLRLPEFATREVFQWAVQEAERNKKRDLSSVTFFPYAEGYASSACTRPL